MTANITAQIEERLNENKAAFKTYASPQFANSNGEKIAEMCLNYFSATVPMRYIVVYLPTRKRFTVVFLLSEFLRSNNAGGYIGVIGDKGFMSI